MTRFSGGATPRLIFVNRAILYVVLMLCLAQVACAPWRDKYFDNGMGVLTQSDVREKLGKPHMVNDPFLSDLTTWTYRFALSESELDPSGMKTLGKQAGGLMGGANGGSREKVFCYMYTLTFDKDGILRHWEREICQIPKPPDPFQTGLSG
ncbi:MAG: hypothetical protein KC592_10215 [Nitrospira sp.]|nr:hypothetical protein [Nitrospira sp.]HBP86293.1 hypothetical protein [Nitrospiraceae bacterium]